MNSLGTSIVNGIYRILINQILQSPSIYYRSELDYNIILVYTDTIISNWGGRLELEIDRKVRIWAHVSRKQKISILVLSSATGSNLREILENVCYPDIFLKKIRSKENVILEFYQQFSCVSGDSRLSLNIPQNNTFLLPRDTLVVTDHLIGMKFRMGTLDDMNHLKNKRICLIDTIEGTNVGLIGSLAIHVRIGHWESLENKKKKAQMLYLSLSRNEYYMVVGIQEEQVILARYCNEFLTIAWEQVHLRTSLIPFIEHNDANRALMSSNMQRQVVPLSRFEKSIVGTGLERQVALDLGVLAIADHKGNIIFIDTDKIILLGNWDALGIPLLMYQRSNKNTCMHQTARVRQGKCIKKGQILVDNAATVGGELTLGKNILDAVLISERLVYEDIYTSFHIRKYETQTHVTTQGPERITNEILHLEAHLFRNLDKNGIVMLGSWVEIDNILVGKLMPQVAKESSYAPEDRLLWAILGIQVSASKETCLKLPIGGRVRVITVRWKREIKVSNKVVGRHRNKGIILKILPRQDMPYLQDGRPVDMVFNPLGLFECSLGLAGSLLDRHYEIASFDERYEQEVSRKLVFSELYQANKKKNRIFDGRTRGPFEQPAIIGKPYILKLIYQWSLYTCYTTTILRGRSKQGGQRVGEIEVWTLEGFDKCLLINLNILELTKKNRWRGDKTYTFHYKTNKLEKDGLFCERIFGPIKSGICACENYREIGNQNEGPKYQMGYIRLACPVTHVWYLKCLPSYITNLLEKPLKELEGLVYCDIRNEKLSSHSIELRCPRSDMSLGKSNMKLKIMDEFRVYTSHIGLGFKLRASWYNRRGTAGPKRSSGRVHRQSDERKLSCPILKGNSARPYPNFSFARPIVKKLTFLRLRGSFEYEIQSWKYSIPLFFTTQGFDTFRSREISTGASAIREQLVNLDL
ncbi:hypothetical protein CXB51_007626 [Gossypium anomalum]|uniref:DNA-directed RNA polymerase n=1 Tax=Gossypium anomalum TaxID=47600 RepID=A0A8J5YZ27_9ROSI|nr:hypothetical protein CXB51_007626 [Gossypium anomalum]